ncbi:MAG: hypothetical protein IPK98_06795 [Chloracidobacterium sp.]|nr:hypothetical protein [Chloracidobacterium sp.]
MTSSTATTQTVFAEQFREFIKGETNDAVRAFARTGIRVVHSLGISDA